MKKLLAAMLLLGAALAAAWSAAPAAMAGAAPAAASPSRPVVLVGIPGLRWTDVSAAATPVLWRLAEEGSVGSLVVHTIASRTCPADGWLTLNAGARAAVPHRGAGPCPQPRVIARPAARATGRPAAATTPAAARRAVHALPGPL